MYPFCDTEGTLGGLPNECVAVDCTPGQFAECRGNVAVTCDATGTNYEVSECERACDPGIGCRTLVPSNGLDSYLDATDMPNDLVLADAVIETSTGFVDGLPSIPSTLIGAPANGSAIRLFIGKRVRIGNLTVRGGSSNAPSLAIVATDELLVEGTVTFDTSEPVAGGVSLAECVGGTYLQRADGTGYSVCSGAGGGGHATVGGSGGGVTGIEYSTGVPFAGGIGGGVSGTDNLVPLRGGCSSHAEAGLGGHGGGAIQLTSLVAVRVQGTIDVRGAAGKRVQHVDTGIQYWKIGGGGAGGGVLLEAPSVELGPDAMILASGGAGASRSADGNTSSGLIPPQGAACAFPKCGVGGNGAVPGMAATSGGEINYDGTTYTTSGGGGGGLGRLRINTNDGTYAKFASTLEVSSVSVGIVKRR